MNTLKTIARTVVTGALSVVQFAGGTRTARDERARIKTSEQAAEFHQKLYDIVQSLPDGPRRDTFARQMRAASVLVERLAEDEEHDRLKKALGGDLKAANADLVRTQQFVEQAAKARIEALNTVAQLEPRVQRLRASVSEVREQAVRRADSAKVALAAAVVAGDEEQEQQAANELDQARQMVEPKVEGPANLRLAEVLRAMDGARAELTSADSLWHSSRKERQRLEAEIARLKANAALVEATFAFAAWSAAGRAAGLGFYDFPHSPFEKELAYRSQLASPNFAWNRTTWPLDDEAFDVDAEVLPDGYVAAVEALGICAAATTEGVVVHAGAFFPEHAGASNRLQA